ncbi:MAG: hypothetical protein QG567_2191, partial [Campylobacterota bacterium]|nr:hypothetical protein [Campylobacterota bacterium]
MSYSNDKFIKRIADYVAREVRTDLEVGGIKRPKIDFLISISEAIVLLLEHLYPLSEQIQLINNIDKSFSISDTTYYRFLKEHLFDSYELHRKNRFFAAKTIEIKRLIGVFPDQYEAQYNHLSLNTKESVTLADYLHFINHYYSPQADAFFNKRALKLQPTVIKGVVPNPDDGGETYLNVTVEEPADNIASVVSDIKKEVVAAKPEVQKEAEKISSGNYSKVGKWKVYEKNEDRYVLK